MSETLVSLDISHNAIGDEGIQHMKQGLLTNQSLENLGLSCAKLTCEGNFNELFLSYKDIRSKNYIIAL